MQWEALGQQLRSHREERQYDQGEQQAQTQSGRINLHTALSYRNQAHINPQLINGELRAPCRGG